MTKWGRFGVCGFATLAGLLLVFFLLTPPHANKTPISSPFAGSASCKECHGSSHALWESSMHGSTLRPYTPGFAAVHLPSSPHEIKTGDSSTAEIHPAEGFMVERSNKDSLILPITNAVGGKNVFYFLVSVDSGRLQTLPIGYDIRRKEWFNIMQNGVRHFSDSIADEPIHWTDRSFTFSSACYRCHVSQGSMTYDIELDTYNSKWAEAGINCETCHGSGAEHIRLSRRTDDTIHPTDLKIIRTKEFNIEQSNSLCASCHAKTTPLTDTFQPGNRFFDHFDLATLDDRAFYPDGRDLGENYTYTSWRLSPCVQSGKLACLYCHTSSGRFRFADEPSRACLPCHSEIMQNVTTHTHHPSGSAGSQCIQCHMPGTEFARMKRSDHSMLPPTPATTKAFGSPNACNLCHADKSATWADKEVRKWYRMDYQKPVLHRSTLIHEARRGDWSHLPEMLVYLTSKTRDEIFSASFLRLLRSCDSGRVREELADLLNDESPLVRAAAVELLGGHITPSSMPMGLSAVRDEYRLVRIRAASALAGVPHNVLDEPQRLALEMATSEFMTALRARPDAHFSYFNLGNFYVARGEPDSAIACYEMAINLEPQNVAVLVNASIAYSTLGRNREAEDCLRKALQVQPENAAANLNLGLLLSEMGRLQEAERVLRAAFKSDPTNATAAYNLGVVVESTRMKEALLWIRKAVELRPGEPKYSFTLAQYLLRDGRARAAIQTLRRMLARHPSYVDAYGMLGEILEEQQRDKEARLVYRRAATNRALPLKARVEFGGKVRALDKSVN